MPEVRSSTRDRIYDAAVVEFAAGGLDGTTIDRIARRADVNRERVYAYFGDKRMLFEHVTSTELARLAAAVPLTIKGPADVGEFAGAAFDYQVQHPHLARLVLWEGLLERGNQRDLERTRGELYTNKAHTVAAAQMKGDINDEIEPSAFVFLLIALASYWLAAPQLAALLVPEGAESSVLTETAREENLRKRHAIIAAATRLATPLRSLNTVNPLRPAFDEDC